MTEFYNLDKNQDGEIQFEEMVEGLIEQFKLTEIVA
jgi:Ca2+-binding EF-hand superfamily protein